MIDLRGVSLLGLLPGEYRRACSTNGGEYCGPCPKCGGEDRFRVWPAPPEGNPRFWCRQCDFKGDAIDYVRWAENLDFSGAKVRLFGGDPIQNVLKSPPRAKKPDTLPRTPIVSESWLRIACGAPARYKHWLDYRGITPPTVDRFKLGYAKLPGEEWGHMRAALILPVFDGVNVVQLRARKLEGGWLTVGAGARLYFPIGVIPNAPLWIVENCANAILICQYSEYQWAACAPTTGAASWRDDWPAMIAAGRPSYVFLAADNDEAGHTMNDRWSAALANTPHEKTVMTPDIEKGFAA